MERDPRSNSHVSGFMLLIFLLAALLFALPSAWEAGEETEESSWTSLLNGDWAKVFEPKYNEKLAHAEPSKDMWGALSFGLFKEGHKGVVVGEDDWLFTSEEFDYSRGAQAYAFANMQYIMSIQHQLQAQDIDLIVALVPSKARMYPEHLGSLEMPHMVQEAYPRYYMELNTYGVKVSHILSAFSKEKQGTQLFLKTDTHWTPEGAHIAANKIADDLRDVRITLAPSEFETVEKGEEKIEGDLERYIPLGPLDEALGPEDEYINRTDTEPVDGATDEDALFGSMGFDTVLIGTSYSADPRWNFVGALKQALGSDVLNLSKEGQGPFEVMDTFIKSQTFSDQPPKLIIWEIPERYMHQRFLPD